ncbi:hypothetical protein AAVH_34234, partial [Aphelenchoides avenae]
MLAYVAVDASSEATLSANAMNKRTVTFSRRMNTSWRALLVKTMRPRCRSCRIIKCNNNGPRVKRFLADAFVACCLEQTYAPEAEDYEECEADADVVVDDEAVYQPVTENYQDHSAMYGSNVAQRYPCVTDQR